MTRKSNPAQASGKRSERSQGSPCPGDEKMYAIFRLDADLHGQDAWAVRLSRGGKLIHMTFSDSTYGGRDAALTVARAYRDAVIKVVTPR